MSQNVQAQGDASTETDVVRIPEDAAALPLVNNEPAIPVNDALPRNARGLARRRRVDRAFGTRFDPAHVHLGTIAVKVLDGAGVKIRNGTPTATEAPTADDDDRLQPYGLRRVDTDAHVASLQAILRATPRASVTPLIPPDREARIVAERARHEAEKRQEFEELTSIFFVSIPDATEAETRAVLAQLRANPLVEYAYVQPHGSVPRSNPPCTDQLPGVTNTTTNALPLNMLYQSTPPRGPAFLAVGLSQTLTSGTDVAFARSAPGGTGVGVSMVDVEGGFNYEHESLPNIPTIGGLNYGDEHGTAVLGIATGCAALQGAGAAGPPGIAPNTYTLFSSVWLPQAPWYSTAAAITIADSPLFNTDVILVEQQLWDFSTSGCYSCPGAAACTAFVPAEYYPIEHAAIRAAVANGRIVVEAAANAQRDLDAIPWLQRFPPNDPQNSGAFVVGGVVVGANIDGASGTACGFQPGTNIGSRVDISAWYNAVDSAGYGDISGMNTLRFNTQNPGDVDQWYTTIFGGTSAASAIVAGATSSLLGIYRNIVGPAAPSTGLTDLLVRTARKQAPGPISEAGPTLQLGMAAAVMRDRVVGDGTDLTSIASVHAAALVTTPTGANVLAIAKTTNSTYVHNMLRGGAWYGWTAMPPWSIFGDPTLRDLQVRQTSNPSFLQVEATAVDAADHVVVSRMTDIDPQPNNATAFNGWVTVTPALTGSVSHATGVDFFAGYHHIFAVSLAGVPQMVYRQYGLSAYAGGPLLLGNPITIVSKIVAVPTGPNQVDLYAISNTNVLYRAYFNGSLWTGWSAVPGGAGATSVAAVKVGTNKVAIVAGWALGATLFMLDLPTGTYTTQSVANFQPGTMVIMQRFCLGNVE